MWNVVQTRSFASAVLITALIQGSLLWGFNDIATEGASPQAHPVTSSLAVTAPELPPETRYVTLAPVLIVGQRQASKTEPAMVLSGKPAQAQATKGERATSGETGG